MTIDMPLLAASIIANNHDPKFIYMTTIREEVITENACVSPSRVYDA